MTVFPERTLALIVGIEDYSMGDDWELNGPALDACRFASWLIAGGVAAENISMLLSPLASNISAVKELPDGIDLGPADSYTVHRAVTIWLYARSSELLVLYLGGHGWMTDDERLLLCADASLDYKHNLNLTSLLKALRTHRYAQHRQQLIFVDTCLSYAHELDWDASTIPHQTLPLGIPSLTCDQRAFFAVSPGQRAVNDDRLRTGLFSRVLRESLQGLVVERISDLDHEQLLRTLGARFDQLRGEGLTDQIPSYLSYSSNGSEQTVIDTAYPRLRRAMAMAAASRHLDFQQHRALQAILDQAAINIEVGETFRCATRNIVELPSPRNVNDLNAVVEALRMPVDPMPLFSFLTTFADGTDDDAKAELWAWLYRVAPRYGVDVDELRSLSARLRRRVYLVRLVPDFLDAGSQVTIWEYLGTEGRQVAVTETPWSPEELAEQLSSYLHGFDPQQVGSEPPIIEFLTPIAMFDERLEDLEITVQGRAEPVGAICPVVVRPIERVHTTGWHPGWHTNWASLESRGDSYDADAILVVEQQHSFEVDQLRDRICTVFAHERAERLEQDPVVLGALAAGIPVMLWQRHSPPKSTLASVVRGRALHNLRDIVRSQRNAARKASNNDHIGKDLVLLWDDPNRVPGDLRLRPPSR